MNYALGALLLLAGVAHADEKLVPTAVAVSSTVDNAKIKPDHLIDGKLDTAWNAVTGEANPWIAVRIPAGAHVRAIKMTVGFTAIDKKLGDLFTENIRIQKVALSRDGKRLLETTLDIENRDLQTLKLDAGGGDYRIDVLTTVPGSKKTWKEVAVSELEVWGTPAPIEPNAKKGPPLVVKIGDLDAKLALTKADCARALGEASAPVVDHDELGLSDAFTVCRRDTREKDAHETTTTIALVDRRTKAVLTQLEPLVLVNDGSMNTDGHEQTGTVKFELVALSTSEWGLIVRVATSAMGPMFADMHDKQTWYRASAKGLTQILEAESYNTGGESGDADTCTLVPFDAAASIPRQIVFECEHHIDPYPGDVPRRQPTTKMRKDRYKWNGTEYVKL
ncbi:MAG TPA: hypothetical protein VGM90_24570 [Kofleriaceae bacterium]